MNLRNRHFALGALVRAAHLIQEEIDKAEMGKK